MKNLHWRGRHHPQKEPEVAEEPAVANPKKVQSLSHKKRHSHGGHSLSQVGVADTVGEDVAPAVYDDDIETPAVTPPASYSQEWDWLDRADAP